MITPDRGLRDFAGYYGERQGKMSDKLQFEDDLPKLIPDD